MRNKRLAVVHPLYGENDDDLTEALQQLSEAFRLSDHDDPRAAYLRFQQVQKLFEKRLLAALEPKPEQKPTPKALPRPHRPKKSRISPHPSREFLAVYRMIRDANGKSLTRRDLSHHIGCQGQTAGRHAEMLGQEGIIDITVTNRYCYQWSGRADPQTIQWLDSLAR